CRGDCHDLLRRAYSRQPAGAAAPQRRRGCPPPWRRAQHDLVLGGRGRVATAQAGGPGPAERRQAPGLPRVLAPRGHRAVRPLPGRGGVRPPQTAPGAALNGSAPGTVRLTASAPLSPGANPLVQQETTMLTRVLVVSQDTGEERLLANWFYRYGATLIPLG